jgi:hypothetical protein
MGLLKSVDNVPGIDYYEYRDEDYYNKYTFRVRFKLPGARYTWYCKTPEDLDKRLEGKNLQYSNIRSEDRQEVIAKRQAIKNFITWRNSKRKEKTATIRVEHNTVAVFSNDLQMLKDLEKIDPTLEYDYTEVQKAEYAGTKHFVNEPKHKFRIYLKSKRVSSDFAKDLSDLINRTPTLYPSDALKIWLREAVKQGNQSHWRYRYCSSSYSINYNDESTLSYIALMHGDMLGKRYKLEKRPEAT